jgi:PhnB protein
VVKGAARAIEFYKEALGAEVTSRFTMPDGTIVHADLVVGSAAFMLTEEDRAHCNDSPVALKGTAVILNLEVDDARAMGARMEKAGAKVLFPIDDQFYGRREGRLVDPFGHMWILSQEIENLAPEEIQRRMLA